MKINLKRILGSASMALLVLMITLIIGATSAFASTTSDYTQFTQPSKTSDYAYWNGSAVVKASGTTTSEIKWMQSTINFCISKGLISASKLEVDGSFGPASKKATTAFQKKFGLSQDGKFGPNTITKMISVIGTYGEKTKPSVSISSTNNFASSQTATLNISDNVGVVAYYFGSSSSPGASSYTSVSSTTSKSVTKSVTDSGTYYLLAKDAAGNVSSAASITYYKTSFSANGGNAYSPSYVITRSGYSITPSTPSRTNYIFSGWSTISSASSGQTSISVSSNGTYYATWTLSDKAAPTVSYTTTKNAAASQTLSITAKDNVGVVAYYFGTSSTPTYTSISSTASITITKTISAEGTYYFSAKDISGNVVTTKYLFCKSVLNAKGGTCSLSYVISEANATCSFPAPTKQGYSFKGWSKTESETSGSTSIVANDNCTFYAIWEEADLIAPSINITTTDDTDCSQTVTIDYSDNVGVTEIYWGDSSTPEYEPVEGDSVKQGSMTGDVFESGTYYFFAKDAQGNVSSKSITFYTILLYSCIDEQDLESGAGYISTDSVLAEKNTTVELPVPYLEGSAFKGWSKTESATSGDFSVEVNEDSVYYAIWGHECVYVSEIIENATCTDEGLELYICTICGDEITNVVDVDPENHSFDENEQYCLNGCGAINSDYIPPACNHVWGDIVEIEEATCTEDGLGVKTCKLCGESTDGFIVYAKGHSWIETVVAPTCQDSGYTTQLCKNCGLSQTKFGSFTPTVKHEFSSKYESSNDATCTKDGTKSAQCIYGCGTVYTVTDTGSALNHSYFALEVKPTCTEEGYTLYSCTNEGCSSSYTVNNVSALGHSFVISSSTDATCNEGGTKEYVCRVCGETQTQYVSALGHDFENEVIAPTCSERGYTLQSCRRCDYETKTSYVAKVSHKFTNYVSNEDATCTADGTKTASCDFECGATNTIADTGSKLGHIYEVNVVAPTCTEAGYSENVCTRCGNSAKISGTDKQALGHTYVLSSTEASTCTEAGSKIYKCKVCGDINEEYVSALGHDFENEVIAPTCSERGYTLQSCRRCDYETKTSYVAKVSHKYTNYISNGDATCTTDGTKTASCDFECGATNTIADTGSRLGHRYQTNVINPTCTEAGYTENVCTRCDNTERVLGSDKSPLGHTYVLSSTTDCTCTEAGSKTYKCRVCGDTNEEYVPALGHDLENEVIAPTCSDRGYTIQSCRRCDYETKTSYVAKVSHKYTNYISNGDATCTTDGTKTASCDFECGATNTIVDTGSRLGHRYQANVINPTCTEAGYTENTCTRCGDIVKVSGSEIAALGHDFVVSSTVNPTCTDAGSIAYKCKACSDVKEEIINPLGHIYHYENTPSSCSSRGYTTVTCDRNCGYESRENYQNIDPNRHSFVSDEKYCTNGCGAINPSFNEYGGGNGNSDSSNGSNHIHQWNSGVETKRVECTEDGEITYTCTICGEKNVKIIDAPGHKYATEVVPPTCEEKGYTNYYCPVCDDTYQRNFVKPLGHSFVVSQEYCLNGCNTWNENYDPTVVVEQEAQKTTKSKKPKKTSIVSLKRAKRSFKIKLKKSSNATGYQIQYSTDSKLKKNKKTIKVKGKNNVSKTVKGLKKNKKYYVRVRAYRVVNGKTYYSSWSAKKSIRTK